MGLNPISLLGPFVPGQRGTRAVIVGSSFVALLGAGCGGSAGGGANTHTTSAVVTAARADLAPTGRLRLGFPAAPPFLGQKDPGSGRWSGFAISMGSALAATLGVSLVPIQYPDAAQTYQALLSGQVDVVLAPSQLKPDTAASTEGVMRVEHSYLVKASSPLNTVLDVDHAGVKVGAIEGEGHTAYLAAHLQHAQLVQFATVDAALAALKAGQIDAYANGRAALAAISAQVSGSRILTGAFFTPTFAFATKATDAKGLTFLNSFVAAQLSSGDVARDIAALNKPGVLVGSA